MLDNILSSLGRLAAALSSLLSRGRKPHDETRVDRSDLIGARDSKSAQNPAPSPSSSGAESAATPHPEPPSLVTSRARSDANGADANDVDANDVDANDAGAAESPSPRHNNLDARSTASARLRAEEEEMLVRIHARIDSAKLELPYLATTSLAIIEMANNPRSDVPDIVQLISTDPSLSSELLKTANSVLYATSHPAETIHEATMRIGLRQLRSLIFSASMKGAVFRGKGLTEYAEEVWRQAYSVATVAKVLAPAFGFDPEKAFLLGLLHDVGKVSLLAMLRKEVPKESRVTPALVGRVFLRYHQQAGREMARQWKLSEEFISVAGNHHDYRVNEEFPRSAALVSLAHRLDLYLSIGKAYEYNGLTECDELDFLGMPIERRFGLLMTAREAWIANEEQAAARSATAMAAEAA